jgi:N-alpha-acetyltransferase 40
MDFDDDVLYCYEIQLESALMRKGLGKFMMKVLELLMIKAELKKIMLTVFKHNQASS